MTQDEVKFDCHQNDSNGISCLAMFFWLLGEFDNAVNCLLHGHGFSGS